jgi:hypothetical protein
MHALLCLTIFLGLAPAPNPTLPNGFYEILDKGAGTSFPCNDGRELILGKSLGKEFGAPTIRSRNNGNTDFGVFLKGAAKLWDGPEPLAMAIVVDNVCMRLSGHTIPNTDSTRDLWFTVAGEEPAGRVARALKCELQLRQDPGHRLTVKWTPDKETYQVGDTITLKFELKNAGKEKVTFRIGGTQRGPRDNQYRFVAQSGYGGGKGVPDTGDPNNFGGMSWTKTLRPDEVYEAKIELNKWFKFETADSYRITGIWQLHLEDPTREGFDQGLWDDLVCGECVVKVEKPKK